MPQATPADGQDAMQTGEASVHPTPAGPGRITPGNISGIVVDASGAVIIGARIKLTRSADSQEQQVISNEQGMFFFTDVVPGLFQITITADGFAPQSVSGTLHAAEALRVPQIEMRVAASTEVQVTPATVAEVAEMQIKQQEQQRVLAVIPNFYVSYIPDAAPLNTRQKGELAWRSTFDPISLALVGISAGIEQAENQYPAYGQGAEGFVKRYGAALADNVYGTVFASFLYPAIFKQDPRYFYKGTGSTRSRFFYALASAVVCKGDNGHWQPNYSNVLGDLTSGALSNTYYPAADRGVGLTLENAAIGIGSSAIAGVFQEFVVKKLTPHANKDQGSGK